MGYRRPARRQALAKGAARGVNRLTSQLAIHGL